MKRSIITVFICLFITAVPRVFAHGVKESSPADSASSSPRGSAGGRQLTFVMVPKGVHPYFEPGYRGFNAAGERYGVRTEVDAPPRFDVVLQVKVIEDLIARGVDGIAISANDDSGLVKVIHEAALAGIKVITFDAPAPSSEALTYIGTDNESAGYEAGKRMARTMGKRGKLAVLQGGLGATNLNLRTLGFRRGLAEVAPRIEVVEVVDEGGDFAESVRQTEILFAKYPDLNAVFSVSAEGAPAAAAVVKQRGEKGSTLIAGFDDLRDTLDGIRDGSIAFCVVQKTYRMGWLSVEILLDAVKGRGLPKVIDTGVVFVDTHNIDGYAAGMEAESGGG